MTTTLKQVIKTLPAARRMKVQARASALIAQERTLRELRRNCEITQKQLAKLLKIGQDSVSRLESREDPHLSTLQAFVKALGGTLRLIVEFPDREPVILSPGNS